MVTLLAQQWVRKMYMHMCSTDAKMMCAEESLKCDTAFTAASPTGDCERAHGVNLAFILTPGSPVGYTGVALGSESTEQRQKYLKDDVDFSQIHTGLLSVIFMHADRACIQHQLRVQV